MKGAKKQILATVAMFCLGFFSHDIISITQTAEDAYYQDDTELYQCTVNTDCDNFYDWSKLFFGEGILKRDKIVS